MEEIDNPREKSLAYALFRALLGLNICLHGVSRLVSGESSFADKALAQFAHTILPHTLVWHSLWPFPGRKR